MLTNQGVKSVLISQNVEFVLTTQDVKDRVEGRFRIIVISPELCKVYW